MSRAYIGLGSNLGDRERTISQAIHQLSANPDIDVLRVSSLRETEPVDYTEQPRFLNGACLIQTDLTPLELLGRLTSVEQALGRERGVGPRFGPRTIDLDLLLYDDEVLEDPDLTVPHPRLADRRFVLEPLYELDPELALPDGTRVRDLLFGEG